MILAVSCSWPSITPFHRNQEIEIHRPDRLCAFRRLIINKIDISVNPGQNKASPRLPRSQALPHFWERNCNTGVRRCIPNRAAIFEISPVGNGLDVVMVSRWHPETVASDNRCSRRLRECGACGCRCSECGAALVQRPFCWHHASDRGTEAPPTFSRGQSSTSTDAIVQQTIMKRNPPLKEPVRWLSSPMILGPKNPPILAVQLMNPTAAAAAELVRKRTWQRPERWQICRGAEPNQGETTIRAVRSNAERKTTRPTRLLRSIAESQNAIAVRGCDRSSSRAPAFR